MKNKDLIVIVGALGSAFKFDKTSTKRSDGSLEYYNYVKTLVQNKSISKIYILSKSDWSRVDSSVRKQYDPYKKIVDIPNEVRKIYGIDKVDDINDSVYYKNYYEYLKTIDKPDFGTFFVGPGLATNGTLPKFLYNIRELKKGIKQHKRILMMAYNYTAHMIDSINLSDFPFFVFANDPRYIAIHNEHTDKSGKTFFRELVRMPVEFIAQKQGTALVSHIKEYHAESPEIVTPVKCTYRPIEKINLVDEKIESTTKDISMTIVAMPATAKPRDDYRFKIMKKYILDKNIDCNIYGRWPEDIMDEYKQFKGLVTHNEIDDIMKRTKYTLVIPILSGWITSKFAEMARLRVVPFLHKDYDPDGLIVPKDHFLRINDSDDLFKKIDFLEKNPEKRELLINKILEGYLTDDTFDGTFIYKLLNKSLKENNLQIELSLNKESESYGEKELF